MLPIFLLVLGTVGCFAGVTLLTTSLKVRGWPVTPGKLIERGVGPSTTTGASRAGRYFEPKVKYTYSVDGRGFTGERLGPATAAYGEEQARKLVQELPEQVQVHYNPQNPAEAFIQATSFLPAVLALAGGVCSLLVGVGLLLGQKK